MAAALTERVDVLVAAIRHPADAHARRQTLEAMTKRLHQDELADLAGGDGEVAIGQRRIEWLVRPEQALHAGQDDVDRWGELQRLGGPVSYTHLTLPTIYSV